MFLASALGRRDKYANAKPGRQSSLIGYMIDKAFDRVLPPVDLSGVAAQLNPISGEAVQPIDLWASFEPPTLPHNLLPDQIEQFARVLSFHMGADAGGLAVAAIATCAGSIPDHVRIQVKRNDASWTESSSHLASVDRHPVNKEDSDNIRGVASASENRWRNGSLVYAGKGSLRRFGR